MKLQGRYVNVVRAHEQIKLVKSTLTNARDNIDGFHSRVYAKALQVASKVQVEESIPRTTGRQQHRSNVPATSPSEYYRRSLTTPLLDYLITEMNDRFSSQLTTTLSQILLLLPSTLSERTEILSSKDVSDLVSMYEDHLPAQACLDAELHCWSVKWKGKVEEAKSLYRPAKVLPVIDRDFFPNVGELLTIACTLPVTSCECERSISRLRYLKTYLRSTMSEERLNGLAMMYVHRDITCDANIIVDKFAHKHPRRLELVNPFCVLDDEL